MADMIQTSRNVRYAFAHQRVYLKTKAACQFHLQDETQSFAHEDHFDAFSIYSTLGLFLF